MVLYHDYNSRERVKGIDTKMSSKSDAMNKGMCFPLRKSNIQSSCNF